MISKCANPNCPTAFAYRQGRLFRFPKHPIQDEGAPNTHSVQHFWLCGNCCETHLLEYDENRGVAIRSELERVPNPVCCKFIAAA